MGKGDRRGKAAPPGCALPKVKTGGSIRTVPDARTLAGKLASQPDPDPPRVALSARARRAGIGDDRHGRKAAAVAYMGCPEGLCLHAVHGDKGTARLWNVWQGLCMAEDAYAYHYLGSRRRATGMKLQLIRKRVETEDFRRDTRTADEKSRDAANRWAAWQGYLGRLDNHHRVVLKAVYWEETPALWADCAATATGLRFVAAVEALADAAEEKRKGAA